MGMTGLATGPHLDFRIQLQGQFLNFERLPFRRPNPSRRRDWNEFVALRDHALAQMPLKSTRPNAVLAKNSAPAAQPGSTT